ncbi:MAG: hypothetical protein ACTSU5_07555, partial [Promethearchaeota archaeon]
VEVDGLSRDPPVVLEVTAVLRDREKVRRFLRKKRLLEAQTGKEFRGFFVASGTELSRGELAEVTVELHSNNCELLNL